MSPYQLIIDFLANPPALNSAWFSVGRCRFFIRQGFHHIDRTRMMTIDIANCEVPTDLRGLGNFTRLVEALEEALGMELSKPLDVWQISGSVMRYAGIYVENIYNDRLYHYLIRKGFTPIPSPDWDINGRAPSVWLSRPIRFGKFSGIDWDPNV